jgi:hypothetical protein
MAGIIGAYQNLLARRPMMGNILTSAVSSNAYPQVGQDFAEPVDRLCLRPVMVRVLAQDLGGSSS